MSPSSRANYETCVEQMAQAAKKWLAERPGVTLAVRLPPKSTAVIGALDDSTIAMLALDADATAFLKELERAGESHGGATVMQAIMILEAIGPAFPLQNTTKAKVN